MPAVAPFFPTDIKLDILSRLPIKSLARFKLACKSWVPLIDGILDQQALLGTNTRILIWPRLPKKLYEYVFLRSLTLLLKEGDDIYEDATTCVSLPTTENLKSWHLLTSPTENLDNLPSQERWSHFELHILGSSNGLICFSISKSPIYPTIVWNPSTGSYKKIPPCPFLLNAVRRWGRGARYLEDVVDEYQDWGFGYYKVLARVRSRSSNKTQFQVYSLQANTWRVLGGCEFPSCILETCYRSPRGLLSGQASHGSIQTPLNGALHWLTRKRTEAEPEGVNNIVNGIVAFDLVQEKFSDFPLADCIALMNENIPKFLAILDGRLCVYYRDIYDSSKTEIWVMKEYGVKESWAPWISVVNGCNFQPIYMFRNKEIVALIDDGKDHDLVTYNPTHKTYRVIKSLCFGWFCGVVYGESLASASPIGHSELTAAVPRHSQPTSCNSIITSGQKTQVITEDDVALYAKFDLPGVDADEVKVRVDLDKYIIHIDAKDGWKDPEFDMGEGKEARKYYLGIKVYPQGSIIKEVKWSFRNGVLKIVVPKREDDLGLWIRGIRAG